jgi:hypothetical protein
MCVFDFRPHVLQPIVAFRDGWNDTISWFKVASLSCCVHRALSILHRAGLDGVLIMLHRQTGCLLS